MSDSYYDDYAEFMADMDDRDDTYDPEFRDPDGYCEHGTYVGGCGADLMCGDCESGISAAERREIDRASKLRKVREQAGRAEKLLNDLLTLRECGGIFAAEMAEISSNVNCPAARYGRTGWR